MSSASDTDEDLLPSVSLIRKAMEARADHLKTRTYRSFYAFTTALGIAAVISALSWQLRFRGGFAWHSNPSIQFNWHPFLMITGMLFLYGQAILVYRTGRNVAKRRLKWLHAIIQIIVFIMAVIGLKAAFDSHNLATPPIPNLYTMHSWIGLVAVIVFAGQWLYGFVTFLYPGAGHTLRSVSLPVHVAIGVATFTLVIVAIVSGLTEKAVWSIGKDYGQFPAEGILVNFLAIFASFYGIAVLYLINEPEYKRTNLPDDEISLAQAQN